MLLEYMNVFGNSGGDGLGFWGLSQHEVNLIGQEIHFYTNQVTTTVIKQTIKTKVQTNITIYNQGMKNMYKANKQSASPCLIIIYVFNMDANFITTIISVLVLCQNLGLEHKFYF